MKISKIDFNNIGMFFTSIITFLVVSIVGIQHLPPEQPKGLVIFLCVVFGVHLFLLPSQESSKQRLIEYFSIQILSVAGLLMLSYSWGVFPILYFIISAQAMMLFPSLIGIALILVMASMTGISVLVGAGVGYDALMSVAAYGSGYLFFGVFGRATAQAEKEKIRSDELLEQLQETHEQLQDYVVRVEELAVSEERNRLAREMHDSLGHRLTVAAVQLEGAQRLVPEDPVKAEGMIATVREQVREALNELRQSVATLRQPLEAGMSIRQAFERMIDTFEQATGLVVNASWPEEIATLPEPHRLVLYRVAQEALTNIQRHAEAKRVWMIFKNKPEEIGLMISDDGLGYPKMAEENGFGLRGIRERVLQLDGACYFENRAGGGAQISIHLPLPLEDAADDD